MYVLDSSTLIELFEDLEKADKIEKFLAGNPLATTTICMHEVLAGALSEKHREDLEKEFSKMLILQHDIPSAKVGARIEQLLTKTGKKIATPDILIAAICRANNGTLVSLDNDFSKIKGLNVVLIR